MNTTENTVRKGWPEGSPELLLTYCGLCEFYSYIPSINCRNCSSSADLNTVEAKGTGTCVASTQFRAGRDTDAWRTIHLVALFEGPSVMAAGSEDAKPGDAVLLSVERTENEQYLPIVMPFEGENRGT